jgi:hypothetical protein
MWIAIRKVLDLQLELAAHTHYQLQFPVHIA